MFHSMGQQVVLPRGLVDDTGARHRVAVLRPLTGWQEAALGAAGSMSEPGEQSRLLAASLERLGGYAEVEVAHTGALSRGDRKILALALRGLMLGDRLALTVRCPNPACGELADVDLRISELLPADPPESPELIEVATPDGPARLREPTGDDEQAVLDLPLDHHARSAAMWSRLLLSLGERGPLSPEQWLALGAPTRHAVALALAEQGTQPDLSFLSRCPACRAWLELDLDPFELLARELSTGLSRLLVEVHALAFHYGWTEDDVLALPRARRWRYLELLRRQVEGRPLLDTWS